MDGDAKKPKILFVEDDTDLSSLYQMRMEMEGFVVTVCSDGERAVQIARDVKPDLILLDLMMPKMDGFTALKYFRDMPETKEAKIIVMSAIAEKAEIERAMSLGADDYIVKSQLSINDTMNRLRSLLGGSSEKAATT